MAQVIYGFPEDLGKQRIRPSKSLVPKTLRGQRKVGVRMLHSRPARTASGKPFPKPQDMFRD